MSLMEFESFLDNPKEQETLNGSITQITIKDKTPKKIKRKKYPKYNVPNNTNGTKLICIDKDLGEWILIFEPAVSTKQGYLDVYLVGEETESPAEIKWAKGEKEQPLKVKRNRIEGLVFEKEVPLKLNVKIEQKGYYCMALKANSTLP